MKINEVISRAKVTKVNPGQSAEIDHGDGTKTVVDLKKNPNALSKDPTTKKIKLQKPNSLNTKKPDPARTVKPGDSVDMDEE